MKMKKRLSVVLALLLAAALLLTACGKAEDSQTPEGGATTAPETTEQPAATAEPVDEGPDDFAIELTPA